MMAHRRGISVDAMRMRWGRFRQKIYAATAVESEHAKNEDTGPTNENGKEPADNSAGQNHGGKGY